MRHRAPVRPSDIAPARSTHRNIAALQHAISITPIPGKPMAARRRGPALFRFDFENTRVSARPTVPAETMLNVRLQIARPCPRCGRPRHCATLPRALRTDGRSLSCLATAGICDSGSPYVEHGPPPRSGERQPLQRSRRRDAPFRPRPSARGILAPAMKQSSPRRHGPRHASRAFTL